MYSNFILMIFIPCYPQERGLWNFDAYLLVLSSWDEIEANSDKIFKETKFWFQIWDLPENLYSKQAGKSFCLTCMGVLLFK